MPLTISFYERYLTVNLLLTFLWYTDASSSEDESSNLTSLENKYKRTAAIPNGQTTFTLTLNVSKARLAFFPVSEVRYIDVIELALGPY